MANLQNGVRGLQIIVSASCYDAYNQNVILEISGKILT